MKEISAVELREYIEKEHEKNYLLIDVRQPSEYEESHIPGSILLPLNEFEEQVEELPEKHLIFYCRSGIRSKAAALTADFFNEAEKNIYTLKGGVLGWNGITIEGMPSFKAFDLSRKIDEILLDAVNLEKGAFRFYEQAVNHFSKAVNSANNKDISSAAEITGSININYVKNIINVMEQARDGELGHAKLIYSHLKKISLSEQIISSSFDDIYKNLQGDILEGGADFEEIIKLIEKQEDKQKSNLHNNKNSQILYILETAVSMEYRAFDLYRVMSERAEDDSLKEGFYSIAQAEKAHMNILVKAFEQYLPQLLRI